MGLFDKKYCDVCGEKIGLLGNRKLEDANLCKNCAAKLSPWFTGRRHTTLEEIKEQLAYREENQDAVRAFHTTRSFGQGMKVLVDDGQKKFMVTRAKNLEEANPDVLDFSQVTSVDLDIDEDRDEIKRKDKDGNSVSFNPPRYEYSYDFNVVIRVNHPYIDEMKLQLNNFSVKMGENRANDPVGAGRPGSGNAASGGLAGVFMQAITAAVSGTGGTYGMLDPEYQNFVKMAQELKDTLLQVQTQIREEAKAADAPRVPVICPHCMATTVPDANGLCEYCGSPVNG